MDKNYQAELIEQTKIWTKKINSQMEKINLEKKGKKRFLDNINAYIKDSAYFFEKKDLVRSFEAIVWAWSWLEIGLDEGILKKLIENSGKVNHKNKQCKYAHGNARC